MIIFESILIFQGESLFKEACLWQWWNTHTNAIHLRLFLEPTGKFSDLASVALGIEGVEIFLIQTFGLAWESCNLGIRKKLFNHIEYVVSYKFEQFCMLFGAQLCEKDLSLEAETGAFWASKISGLLDRLEISEKLERFFCIIRL